MNSIDDKTPKPHWGHWIAARAKELSIATQAELAAIVGIAPENLSRILKRPSCPRLRKKSIAAFARALHVTEQVIRNEWHEHLSDSPALHWGLWVSTRAQAIGIGTHDELAKRIDLEPASLSRMLKHHIFPHSAEKVASKIALALHTHEQVVRVRWVEHEPIDAPAPHLYPYTGQSLTDAQFHDLAQRQRQRRPLIDQVFESPETIEAMRTNAIFLGRLLNPEQHDADTLRRNMRMWIDFLEGEGLLRAHKAMALELEKMLSNRRSSKNST